MMALKWVEFLALVTEVVTQADDSKKMKINGNYKPREWRWLNVKPLASKSLRKVINEENKCCFRHIHTVLETCLILLQFG